MTTTNNNKVKSLIKIALAGVFILGIIGIGVLMFLMKPIAKELLQSMDEERNIEYMINEKYQKLPCFNAQVDEDTYCFDRSRITNMKIYTKLPSAEFYAFQFTFVSKIVPKHNNNQNVIKYVSLDAKDYTLQDFIYKKINNGDAKKTSSKNVDDKKYADFIHKNNNKLADITSFEGFAATFNDKTFVLIENNIPIAYIQTRSNEYYKFIGDIVGYQKLGQPLTLSFQFLNNTGENIEDVVMLYISVADEIMQFLADSKVSSSTN